MVPGDPPDNSWKRCVPHCGRAFPSGRQPNKYEDIAIVMELGCDHVINYATEDFVDRVREITNGEGVHVVYESIGKATLKCLRIRGMCAAYGHASGAPDPIDIVEELGVPGSLFMTRPALFHYLTPPSALLATADDGPAQLSGAQRVGSRWSAHHLQRRR
jgi:hypothetical protein